MIKDNDWDPLAPGVLADPTAAYDDLRRGCPVAYSEKLGWSVFRHADVLGVVHDTETFSSVVSTHLAVPSGMDRPKHTPYRGLVESYFTAPKMAKFEPTCRKIAQERVRSLPRPGGIDLMADFAHPFALDVQCTFTGWPQEIQDRLRDWLSRSQQASVAGDRQASDILGQEFESIVEAQLKSRRAAGSQAPDDPTTGLLAETIDGRALSLEEITSILRNWTAGELTTISASIGILVCFLARDTTLQEELRRSPAGLPAAIEEILRIEGPLLCNRRKVVKDTVLAGRTLAAGERLAVMWAAANRDETVFEHPETFRPDRDQQHNLLWGAGIHQCPGAPLARLELRVVLECLLEGIPGWRLSTNEPLPLAVYPSAGFERLPIHLD
jgi:cytochrome P450